MYDGSGRLQPLEGFPTVTVEGCPCSWEQAENAEILQLFRIRGSGPCDMHSDDYELLIRVSKHIVARTDPHDGQMEPPC